MKDRIAVLTLISLLCVSGHALGIRYSPVEDEYARTRATFRDAVSDPRIGKVVVKQGGNAFVANDSTGKIAFANATGTVLVYDLNDVAISIADGDPALTASIRKEISESLRENAGVIAEVRDSNNNGIPDEQTTPSEACSDPTYSCGVLERGSVQGIFVQSFIQASRIYDGGPPNPTYCTQICTNLANDEEDNFDAAMEVMLGCLTAEAGISVPVCLHGIYRWQRAIRRYRANYRVCVYECHGTPSRW
jgi:hypothetical protein